MRGLLALPFKLTRRPDITACDSIPISTPTTDLTFFLTDGSVDLIVKVNRTSSVAGLNVARLFSREMLARILPLASSPYLTLNEWLVLGTDWIVPRLILPACRARRGYRARIHGACHAKLNHALPMFTLSQ